MVARQKPHHFAALCVDADIRSKRIHDINGICFAQLPRTGRERIGFGHQSANRAKINDISLQIAVERLTEIAGNFRIFTAPSLTHLGQSGHFRCEAHTAGAGNAAGHMGLDQRAQIQILCRPLGLTESAEIHTIRHCLVLQIALAALITDWAVQRVVDEQKFHHPFPRFFHHRRIGFDNRQLPFWAGAQIAHLHRARGRRLRRPAHDFHQTHATVASDGQTLMVTKTWHLNPDLFTGLDQRHRAVYFNFLIVDDDFSQVRHIYFAFSNFPIAEPASISASPKVQ